MKRLSISAGLIALLAVASALHVWHLNDFTGQLAGLLTQAQEQAEQGNWEEAARLTRQAQDRWMEHESYLHITLRHSDTDAVYTRFREVHEFLQCREGGEYSAANACLIAELELLAEAEQFTIENVL